MAERNTVQKQAVLDVLSEATVPLTVGQILHRARQRVASISQATVYRIVKRLLEKQAISTVELPNAPPLYELAGKGHHHFFRCRKCRKMFEVDGCENLLGRLVPDGFRLEDHEVYLSGLCSGCSDQ